jgi:poly(3-hydroxybutyrate) depolymerase
MFASLFSARIAMRILVLMLFASVAAAQITRTPGCITSTTPGDHTFMCENMPVYVHIPAACPGGGCGLILEIHGDGGTGPLQDAHLKLADLGEKNGYILLAPTGGGFPPTDDALFRMVRLFSEVLKVNPKKIHVTGFSRGGFAVWRLACDHADFFASAAPAAAGVALPGETSCFSAGNQPSRKIPLLQMIGLNDRNVPPNTQTAMRDLLIERWKLSAPQKVSGDENYTHNRYTGPNGELYEVFEHRYEMPRGGGHCVPGSTAYNAPLYAYGCQPPNAFNLGEEVIRFFQAHPMP